MARVLVTLSNIIDRINDRRNQKKMRIMQLCKIKYELTATDYTVYKV